VPAARDALEAAAHARGWTVTRIQDSATFCRLVVHGPQDVLVDLVVDTPAMGPVSDTALGPTLPREDLAGRKLLALFDRAAARDFADVFALRRHFTKEQLLAGAAAVDLGFDRAELARQMRMLERYSDPDVPCPPDELSALREYFQHWSLELSGP
jgi:Nucleotidyl transferase AbiEii toxin, Type IV TA system